MEFPDRGVTARWLGDGLPPSRIAQIDDRIQAREALGRLRRGYFLLHRGSHGCARQLLAALGRRLSRPARRGAPLSPRDIFRAERETRQVEHETLSHLLVELGADGRMALKGAPDVAAAVRWRWGSLEGPALVPLRALLGVVGAHEWYRRGIEVPGLPGRLQPHYGVFTPTRAEVPALLAALPDPAGKTAFDVGTGTGVLGFLLLARGACRVVATDIDPAAVACARDNAERLGFGARFEAQERDLFPEGRADIVVCNPPWLPERPRGGLDRAVFDPDGRFLARFIDELPAHVRPGGVGFLLLSDLAELLDLRPRGFVAERAARAGLAASIAAERQAGHPRAVDREDPLHEVRSKERIFLYRLDLIAGASDGPTEGCVA